MKKSIFTPILLIISTAAWAQSTFKAGWNTYNTSTLTHEYLYNCALNDSIILNLADSSLVFATSDSLVTLTIHYPLHDKSIYKTINYLNPKKMVIKTEEYKDDNMLVSKEWRYDDKGFKNYYYEDNKVNGNNYRKTYDQAKEKKTGEVIANECSYFNGRIEFYTKTYYDKNNVKYKEVRLNDNNKDVVHIETFIYGDNGKLTERSVFFPEWHVTKKFPEKGGNALPKCSKTFPVGIPDKVTIPTRIAYMKKALAKNRPIILDTECPDFEYKFRNWTNCEIVVTNGVNSTVKKVVFRYKDKM